MSAATKPQRVPKASRRELTPEQRKYWQLWREACTAQGWNQNDRAQRMAVHHRLFGAPISLTEFRHQHFDRAIPLFRHLSSAVDLDAAIALVQFEDHDAAQAKHQPVVRPGRNNPDRAHPRKYEDATAVDDPGQRRRCLYVLSRLFEPALLTEISRDLFSTAKPWDELTIPQLLLLRDTLKSRLGKWLTRAKEGGPGHDQLAGLQTRTGSNVQLIEALVKRGTPIRLVKERQTDIPF
jgi:hypothetical protein